jgi:nucleoside-diphosphate-sugar epimerase
MSESILVTGGAGFIGSNISKYLADLGHRVYIIDQIFKPSGANSANLEDVKVEEFTKADLYQLDLFTYLQSRSIQWVIHCAAISSHSFAHHHPREAFQANVDVTHKLLEAIRLCDWDIQLINIGTTTQFGRLNEQSNIQKPTDFYSLTKVLTENLVDFYRDTYQQSAISVRLPNVYGPKAPIHDHRLSFINYFIGLVLQNKAITVYGSGHQLRTMLHVWDICHFIDQVMNLSLDTLPSSMTLGSNDHQSVADLATIIAQASGGKVKFVDYPEHAKKAEVGDQVYGLESLHNQLPASLLTWLPHYSFSSSIHDVLAWYQTKLPLYVS